MISTSNNTVEKSLEGLEPFTVYSISIQCLPYLKENGKEGKTVGLYSDPVTFESKTLASGRFSFLKFESACNGLKPASLHPSVPGSAPEVTPGAFSITDQGSNRRKVDIYWKVWLHLEEYE